MAGEDLTNLASQLGLSTDFVSGGYVDPSDPMVFVGYPDAGRGKGGVLGTPDILPGKGSPAAQATGNVMGLKKFTGANTKPASQVENLFYAKSPEEIQDLQRRMFNAGLYGRMKAEDIPFGDYDEASFSAWKSLVNRSAGFYAAGKQLTPDDVLDMALGLAGPEGRGARDDDGAGGPKRAPLVIELPSPDDLAKVAQRAAVSTLGRGLRPDELQSFVGTYQSQMAAYQRGSYAAAAPDGGGGTVTRPASAEVAAEAHARQANPTEASAHDFVNVYDSFAKLISRGVVGGAGG